MTKDELIDRYFEWMYQLVCNDKYNRGLSYRKLLAYLHTVEFIYSIPMDDNRVSDGIGLRYRFGCECGYESAAVATFLDDTPCSVLEVMVALALRCEETIMDNPEVGDRTGQWFWNMILSLGLAGMSNEKFNRDYAKMIVERFLNREYEPDGHGSLFTVENPPRDMRSVEIWCQMCWYLDEFLEC